MKTFNGVCVMIITRQPANCLAHIAKGYFGLFMLESKHLASAMGWWCGFKNNQEANRLNQYNSPY